MRTYRWIQTGPMAAVAASGLLVCGTVWAQPDKPVGATTTDQAPDAGTSRGAASDWFEISDDDVVLEQYPDEMERDYLFDRELDENYERFDYRPSERMERQNANQRAVDRARARDQRTSQRPQDQQQRSWQARRFGDLPSNEALAFEYDEELEDANMLLEDENYYWDEVRHGTNYGVTGPQPHDRYRRDPDTWYQYDEKYPRDRRADTGAQGQRDQGNQREYEDPYGEKIPMFTNEPDQAEAVIDSERQKERHVMVTPGDVGVDLEDEPAQQRQAQRAQPQPRTRWQDRVRPQGQPQVDQRRSMARQDDAGYQGRPDAEGTQQQSQYAPSDQDVVEEGVERNRQRATQARPRGQQMTQQERPLYTQNTTAPGLVNQQQRARAARQRAQANAAQRRAYWAGVQRGQIAGAAVDDDVDFGDGGLAAVGGRIYPDAEAVSGTNVYTDDWYDLSAPFYGWYAY